MEDEASLKDEAAMPRKILRPLPIRPVVAPPCSPKSPKSPCRVEELSTMEVGRLQAMFRHSVNDALRTEEDIANERLRTRVTLKQDVKALEEAFRELCPCDPDAKKKGDRAKS